jgi:putative nucleotidyltransferase with HDIG domain
MNKILSKNFLKALFIKQNRWHRYSVLGHTLAVTLHAIKAKEYKFITAALLHDIGKPYSAYADEEDIKRGEGELSFTNHEELSYIIIKNWPFVSQWTKLIVRHHYLIRGMKKAKEKGKLAKYRRLKRVWDSLDDELKKDLGKFLVFDDLGKK